MTKKPPAPKGAPEWMVTYGDMVSLLLCFFVLLYSMSASDAQKMVVVIESLNGAFGFNGDPNKTNIEYVQKRIDKLNYSRSKGGDIKKMNIRTSPPDERSKGDESPRGEEAMLQFLPRADLGQEKGFLIQFKYGLAELDPAAKVGLKEFYAGLVGNPYKLVLKGYSSLGEEGPYRQGINLAYARAVNVRNYLVSLGMKNNQFQILVLGEHEPLTRETLPTGTDRKEANSVVMIVVSSQSVNESRSHIE